MVFWEIFDGITRSVFRVPADDIRFVVGVAPATTVTSALVAIGLYYVIIFGGQYLMRDQKPIRLSLLFKIHNALLSVWSAFLYLLIAEQVLPVIYNHGLFYSICHPDAWNNRVAVLYYLNYMTKFLEFFDTYFLVLRKKPLQFLHTYHHGATAMLCYVTYVGCTPINYVVVELNLLVHTLMYWYYFQAARGIRITWKKWITIAQIIQFVIDLVFIYTATYTYFAFNYFPWMPNLGNCAGAESAAVVGSLIISSYLFLFIGFYISTYSSASRRRSASASNGTLSAPKEVKRSSRRRQA